MISDSIDQQIDNILIGSRQRMEDRSGNMRSSFRRKKFWKKRARRVSKTTQLARSMGTKVFYARLNVSHDFLNDGFGKLTSVFNLRNDIAAHDDFNNFKTLFGRIQCTSIALEFRPYAVPSISGFQSVAIGCYDSDVGSAITSLSSAESFAKKMYFSNNTALPQRYAFKTEQAHYSLQNTESFSTDHNIIGYWKNYCPVGTANAIWGTVILTFNLYFFDRK